MRRTTVREREWRLGRLVKERFVGLIVSAWPMHQHTEWVATGCFGPVKLQATVNVPRRGQEGVDRE